LSCFGGILQSVYLPSSRDVSHSAGHHAVTKIIIYIRKRCNKGFFQVKLALIGGGGSLAVIQEVRTPV
jgi:hypothetical protein